MNRQYFTETVLEDLVVFIEERNFRNSDEYFETIFKYQVLEDLVYKIESLKKMAKIAAAAA